MLIVLPVLLLLLLLLLLRRLMRERVHRIAPIFTGYCGLLILSTLNWLICYSPLWTGISSGMDVNGLPVIDWARHTTRWFALALPVSQLLLVCESLWQTTDYTTGTASAKRGLLWSVFTLIGISMFGVLLWAGPPPVAPFTSMQYYWRLGLHLGMFAGLLTSLGFLLLLNRRVYTASELVWHQGLLLLYLLGSVLADLPAQVLDWTGRTYATECIHLCCFAGWLFGAKKMFGVGICYENARRNSSAESHLLHPHVA